MKKLCVFVCAVCLAPLACPQENAVKLSLRAILVDKDLNQKPVPKLAFVLVLLGHDDVAVYDGGWADWGDRLDLPVER